MKKAWWKEAVVYQIYPRSFADGNGDGLGDCKGVMQHLDYLKDLGIDVIWFSPIYKSPMDDNGYDISDYYDINPEFGTLEEFKQMLDMAHERGIKVLMDLVVNHTSDEHPWFIESRKSKDNPYRDYYIWRDPVNGGPPSDWGSHFSGSAWEYDEATGQYYLHLFSKKQPDLNWENPAVRSEVFKNMRWWCDLGIDGFRMDTVNMYSKVPGFPNTGVKNKLAEEYFIDGPKMHDYLREMNREVMSKYDVMTVGEAPGIGPDQAALYVGEDRGELNMVFQFDHVRLDRDPNGKYASRVPLDLREFKKTLDEWQYGLANRGWNSLYLNNHDQPRQVSRFGDDGKYWKESAKMLATMLHTMQGTPYIYEGEEIGMTNCPFRREDLRDIEVINQIKEFEEDGVDVEEKFPLILENTRDNARTPMQWTSGKNAGFSEAEPWIMVNPNYKEINVAAQENDPDSILSYYKQLIRNRRAHEVIVYGEFQDLDPSHGQVYCYTRTTAQEELLVILNLTKETVPYTVPTELSNGWKCLISNYPDTSLEKEIILRPYEALVYVRSK